MILLIANLTTTLFQKSQPVRGTQTRFRRQQLSKSHYYWEVMAGRPGGFTVLWTRSKHLVRLPWAPSCQAEVLRGCLRPPAAASSPSLSQGLPQPNSTIKSVKPLVLVTILMALFLIQMDTISRWTQYPNGCAFFLFLGFFFFSSVFCIHCVIFLLFPESHPQIF